MAKVLLNSDGGYSNLKIFDGIRYYIIPSLYISAQNVKPSNSIDSIDNMFVIIQENNSDGTIIQKEIVVGKRAIAGRAKYDFNSEKYNSLNTIYPSVVGFAYALLNKGINYAELDITTTLTIDDFIDNNILSLEKGFLKEWKIKFLYGHLKGKECHFIIKRNLTSEQCAVGMWNHLIDNNNKIIKPIKNKKYLGIDIGFETTCVYIMEDGEDDGRSQNFYIGMSDYNSKIIKEINHIYKLRKNLEEMESILIKKRIGNKDFSHISNKHYLNMTKEIINAISFISSSTIEFDEIFLIGGGAIPSYPFFKQNSEYSRIIISANPQIDNLIGAAKLSRLIWKDGGYINA